MRPTVGRSVHYQRGSQTLHAVITRCEQKPIPGTITSTAADELLHAYLASEDAYDVWLAVFLHTSTIGSVEFSPTEIQYSPDPVDKHWSWPPRVG